MPPGLIVICGPTATGKSRLAMALATERGLPILSADSRQIYRGFDIGTAKPSPTDRAQVHHEFIDICDPIQTFTVAEYQQQAQALIAQYHAQGITPLLVGGTGLYIRAVVQGLQIPRVGPQGGLRSQLQSLGQTQLHAWLQQIDPAAAAKIHRHDQVRTLRALEVYYVTGVPLSQQQGSSPPPYPILQIGLDVTDPHRRNQQIQHRTSQMLAQGWLAEVQTLMQTYGGDLSLLATLGYQELRQYLIGRHSLQEAEALIVTHTRQFAKRQRTWFRADPSIHWFNATAPELLTTIDQKVQLWCDSCGATTPAEANLNVQPKT